MYPSKCPTCQNTAFELSSQKVIGLDNPLVFVQCSNCRTAIGVLERVNMGQKLDNISKKLGVSEL
ncbi:hypothetical protein Fluta_0684 [Fluviicola taffensis DSM 16823]|uniref:Uncharacterized protein n=1 Tax=Fluviicola taffensis (strain DSM 16823 / NCIMB 13979 / RW262) TaxID=755732 RepID=F2IHD3_FLUTR|nr:hypothetical protein Fluta_0684 [Fluviicola taffensis DSM 16823]